MAEKPNLHDVRILAELERVDDVNRHLAAGWILVKPPAEDELFYVVGWPHEGEAPHPRGPTLADLHAELEAEVAKTLEERKGP